MENISSQNYNLIMRLASDTFGASQIFGIYGRVFVYEKKDYRGAAVFDCNLNTIYLDDLNYREHCSDLVKRIKELTNQEFSIQEKIFSKSKAL